MLHNAEVDEPESTAVPTLPDARRRVLVRDDPSTDTVVDVMTEEELLKAMEKLVPMEPLAGVAVLRRDLKAARRLECLRKLSEIRRHRFGLT
jgi:hypothetical protein